MIATTTGIVLRTQPYNDSSLIVRIYTVLYGMQSYILRGVKNKSSKTPVSLFQIPNILELIVNKRENSSLHTIREAYIHESLNGIRSDIIKSSIALFISELVYKSLREEEENEYAFTFLKTALLQLNNTDDPVANFHLAFMLKWTKVLGFYPNNDISNGNILNLEEGSFTYKSQKKELNVHPPLTDVWRQLQETELRKCSAIPLNAPARRQLLDHLQNFYLLHLPGFTRLKSPGILSAILS